MSVSKQNAMNCCDLLAHHWTSLFWRRDYSAVSSMESLLDQITTRQVTLELHARRCLGEARRYHAQKSKSLFRAKMLEHRRVNNQIMQLQQYKENALAQMDAMSNNDINQQFVRAMKGLASTNKNIAKEDVESTIDEMHESMSQAKELSSMLGQTVGDQFIDDEELEREFLEEEEHVAEVKLPSAVPATNQQITAETRPLRVAALD
jgi:nitrogen regulatory protein PII-like uncharacterized protein